MKSAGNDIVALNGPNIDRAGLPAFYSKFVNASELKIHQQPALKTMPVAHFNWLLWSVKESAFKYLKRLEPGLLFSPARIIVKNVTVSSMPSYPNLTIEEGANEDKRFFDGRVCFQNGQLYFHTMVSSGYMATVVNNEAAFDNIFWGIGFTKDESTTTQSKAVRASILLKLGAVLNTGGLAIEKDNYSIPHLKKDGSPLNIPVSLAHHHHFFAYSFAING